ncbi:hypothetical protein HYN56_19920 [Flavobacterium crocinum]|uniref:Uncharacterized protein n=2 Tax=Flavobacterium crocinum TaxID=2183896 RepID=A0A2S1YQI4_9FLAO|nr:hypothetical protein HYN56_19920 [Flavobacterium crocinum]
MSCSLEELTQLIIPNDGSSILSGEITATEKENQAAVLETLIQLDSQGLIFLDSDADRSVITTKGMLKVHNRILCN